MSCNLLENVRIFCASRKDLLQAASHVMLEEESVGKTVPARLGLKRHHFSSFCTTLSRWKDRSCPPGIETASSFCNAASFFAVGKTVPARLGLKPDCSRMRAMTSLVGKTVPARLGLKLSRLLMNLKQFDKLERPFLPAWD